MPQRSWSTRKGDEMRFHTAIDLASQRTRLGIVAAERSLQALLHEALFDADDGAGTDVNCLGNVAAGGRPLIAFVGCKQHAGGHLLMGCGLAGMDQLLEFLSLLCAQMDGIAFLIHDWSLPWLFSQFLIFSLLCQIQLGGLRTPDGPSHPCPPLPLTLRGTSRHVV